jgi:hypothetical protein
MGPKLRRLDGVRRLDLLGNGTSGCARLPGR